MRNHSKDNEWFENSLELQCKLLSMFFALVYAEIESFIVTCLFYSCPKQLGNLRIAVGGFG